MSENFVCKACGEPLGDPQKEFGDDGHYDFVEGRPDDDPRVHCSSTGQIHHPESVAIPESEYQGGSPDDQDKGSQEESQFEPAKKRQQDAGLNLEENPEPLDLLSDVLTNPIYELSDPQISEAISWAKEFDDGMIPPDSLEQILGLMEGVSKQKSELMRQKYELKLQRWMRQRTEGEQGPPIGMLGARGGSNTQSINITRGQSTSNVPQSGQRGQSADSAQPIEHDNNEPERVIDRRSDKARERVDEFLNSFAENVGNDVGTFYSDAKHIVKTALMKKAEQDPDWVLEKLETVGGFELLNEIMQPSDAKQQQRQQQQRTQPSVDMEVDEAAQSIMRDTNPQQQNQQPQPQPQEQRQKQQHSPQQQSQSQNTSSEQQSDDASESIYVQEDEISQQSDEKSNPMERLIEQEGETKPEEESDEEVNEMFEETLGQIQED